MNGNSFFALLNQTNLSWWTTYAFSVHVIQFWTGLCLFWSLQVPGQCSSTTSLNMRDPSSKVEVRRYSTFIFSTNTLVPAGIENYSACTHVVRTRVCLGIDSLFFTVELSDWQILHGSVCWWLILQYYTGGSTLLCLICWNFSDGVVARNRLLVFMHPFVPNTRDCMSRGSLFILFFADLVLLLFDVRKQMFFFHRTLCFTVTVSANQLALSWFYISNCWNLLIDVLLCAKRDWTELR